MTLFAEILHGCGLSHREAADYLKVSVGAVSSYAADRRSPPQGILDELHDLADRQEQLAEQAVESFDAAWEPIGHQPAEIEIGLASDDEEARTLGMPCVGAHRAAIRRMWELLPVGMKIIIVPRGSTLASAGAADLHDSLE